MIEELISRIDNVLAGGPGSGRHKELLQQALDRYKDPGYGGTYPYEEERKAILSNKNHPINIELQKNIAYKKSLFRGDKLAKLPKVGDVLYMPVKSFTKKQSLGEQFALENDSDNKHTVVFHLDKGANQTFDIDKHLEHNNFPEHEMLVNGHFKVTKIGKTSIDGEDAKVIHIEEVTKKMSGGGGIYVEKKIPASNVRIKAEGTQGEWKLQGKTTFAGLKIAIENKKGSIRSGKEPSGKPWSVKMPFDYGYVIGTEGTDGDEVDVFLGPVKNPEFVYIVHQHVIDKPNEYDEDKCMLGWASADAAKKAYHSAYNNANLFMSMTTMSLAEFKKKVKSVIGKIHAAIGPHPFEGKKNSKGQGIGKCEECGKPYMNKAHWRIAAVAGMNPKKCAFCKAALNGDDFLERKGKIACPDCADKMDREVTAGGPGSGQHPGITPERVAQIHKGIRGYNRVEDTMRMGGYKNHSVNRKTGMKTWSKNGSNLDPIQITTDEKSNWIGYKSSVRSARVSVGGRGNYATGTKVGLGAKIGGGVGHESLGAALQVKKEDMDEIEKAYASSRDKPTIKAGGPGSGRHKEFGDPDELIDKHEAYLAKLRKQAQAARESLQKDGKSVRGKEIVSDRAKLAKAKMRLAGKEVQDQAEAAEHHVVKSIKGEKQPDNSPFDVTVKDSNGKKHGLEVKAFITQKNDKVTNKTSAINRKLAFAKKNGIAPGRIHTIVVDYRGAGEPKVYHKGGLGSFQLSSMTPVKNGLKGLSRHMKLR